MIFTNTKTGKRTMADSKEVKAGLKVPDSPIYKYEISFSVPFKTSGDTTKIASINGKTPEKFAKTEDIYKDVATRLDQQIRAQHTQNFVQYYKDGHVHVAFVKRTGHEGVPIRGDNLAEVMQAASALLYSRVD